MTRTLRGTVSYLERRSSFWFSCGSFYNYLLQGSSEVRGNLVTRVLRCYLECGQAPLELLVLLPQLVDHLVLHLQLHLHQARILAPGRPLGVWGFGLQLHDVTCRRPVVERHDRLVQVGGAGGGAEDHQSARAAAQALLKRNGLEKGSENVRVFWVGIKAERGLLNDG
jgi:hypothetical protein